MSFFFFGLTNSICQSSSDFSKHIKGLPLLLLPHFKKIFLKPLDIPRSHSYVANLMAECQSASIIVPASCHSSSQKTLGTYALCFLVCKAMLWALYRHCVFLQKTVPVGKFSNVSNTFIMLHMRSSCTRTFQKGLFST